MTTEKPDENLLLRIRKLLSRTQESGCTAAEAETAFNMATRLMAEHNLDMKAVEFSPSSYVEESIFSANTWTLESNLLSDIVRRFFFVDSILMTKLNMPHKKYLYAIGKPENVETARWVWGALTKTVNSLWDVYRIRNGCPKSEKRTYTAGALKGFADRMQREQDAMKAERDAATRRQGSTGTALVAIADDLRKALVAAHPDIMFRTRSFARTGRDAAYQDGFRDGQDIRLNREIDAAKRKQLG